MNKDKLISIIIKNIEEVLRENNEQIVEIDENTVIFGDNSLLDSLGLVSLIVMLEDYLLETNGKETQIVDDETLLSGKENPLRTPKLLAELILGKIIEK